MSAPTASSAVKIPPLRNGDHLDRNEFERRSNAMPDVKKAELIDGVVYMPSPVRFEDHAAPHLGLSQVCAALLAVGIVNATNTGDINSDRSTWLFLSLVFVMQGLRIQTSPAAQPAMQFGSTNLKIVAP